MDPKKKCSIIGNQHRQEEFSLQHKKWGTLHSECLGGIFIFLACFLFYNEHVILNRLRTETHFSHKGIKVFLNRNYA